jgi:hypothetical protein
MAAPPPPGAGAPAPGARPGVVTAAGILLIVAGAFAILGGLLSFGAAGLGGIFVILAVILLAIGALEIYAGIQILGLRERGRIIGLVVAGIGAIFSLIFLITAGDFTQIISLALDAFVIWALMTNQQYFHA